ncbi:hypothetical protein PVIIG_04205 [Plasmodium vivax India VII]|nr:hypothetical protein PVIIG_04205 [Plasmodium vivax India VII]KNA02362.1 hypothetical protein PVNG_01516 [Plasmodium vivax North Korean]
MIDNKDSDSKEALKEKENASEVGTESQLQVYSGGESVGTQGEEGSVYYYSGEGDGDEGSVYYCYEDGTEGGEGEEGSVYYYHEGTEGGEGEEGSVYYIKEDEDDGEGSVYYYQEGTEGGEGEEESVYYPNQEGMVEDIERQMHNLAEEGMSIIDHNDEDMKIEHANKLPRRREPDDAYKVDKKKLNLADYKEWLGKKEYPLIKKIVDIWSKIVNCRVMIWYKYFRGDKEEQGMPINPEWQNWMQDLKNEWSRYNAYIHKERNKWFQEKEEEFHKFIEDFQFKWMHYNKELLEDHSFDVYKKSLKWQDSKWIKWIEKDGESIMMMDIEKWIDKVKSEYDLWLLKDWEQWKTNKIMDWLLSEKKCDQYQYWLKWEYSNEKTSLRKERIDWYKWKKIRQSEAKEWQKWVREKDQALLEVKNAIWLNWKEDKKNIFFSMLHHFINNWIAKKQWNVWARDIHRELSEN